MRLLLPLALLVPLVAGCTYAVSMDATTDSRIIGSTAPDFTQNDTSGSPISLSQFRGKVVLIDFWASWCQPCVMEIPYIKQLWQNHRDQGLVVLSVSLDKSLEAWKVYIRLNDLDWYHVADGNYWNNAVARLYNITSIPSMYLIGRDGTVIAATPNGDVMDEQTITHALK